MFEQIKVRYRLTDQELGLRASALYPKDGDKGGLSGGGIGPDWLPGLRFGTFDIEQIVGDLVSQSKIVGIAAQRSSDFTGRLGENRAGLA